MGGLGCRIVNRSVFGYRTVVERRSCWDRVLVGDLGNSYCLVVDLFVVVVGRGAVVGGSRGVRLRVSAFFVRRGFFRLVVEVRGDCGLGWLCFCCRERKKGRGVSGWRWAAVILCCFFADRAGSRLRGRSSGRAVWRVVGCSTVSGAGLGFGLLVYRLG